MSQKRVLHKYMTRTETLEQLSNRALDDALLGLVAQERDCVADILAHLAEVDRRTMYVADGFSSLFRYAVEHLHMTEAAAGHRITAARLLARFPQIRAMVASGALHVAGLKLLSPHLSDDNHEDLLAAARNKSKRAIEELLAARYPKTDVLPLIVAQAAATNGEPNLGAPPATLVAPTALAAPANGRTEPLSADSFAITFTIDRACKDKLAQAQALLSHRVPGGDVGAILDLALDALLSAVRKQRFAVTDTPRKGRARKPGTRYISAEEKRAVWQRDGERCAFVSETGRRCTETRFLELHHVAPHGRGGAPVANNLQVLCRVHNDYWADVDYGAAHMARVKAAAPARLAARVDTTPPPVPPALIRDATAALSQLGFNAAASHAAVADAAARLAGTCSLEKLLRESLRQAPRPAATGATSAREPIAAYRREPRGSYPGPTGLRHLQAPGLVPKTHRPAASAGRNRNSIQAKPARHAPSRINVLASQRNPLEHHSLHFAETPEQSWPLTS